MRADQTARDLLAAGFAAIRTEAAVSGPFTADVEAAASAAVPTGIARRDATDLAFVTLDPATSTDLDQAFALSRDGNTLVLHYAIADIGAFVERGGIIERAAWERGSTVYAPDGSVPLYPRVLSQGKASLLPDGPRPAVLLTVAVAPDGSATLRNAERAMVASRAKLAYDTVAPHDLPADIAEFSARILANEDARGAFRVELPEQEVIADADEPSGVRLRFQPRLASEELNSTLSLAANLAVADAMHRSGFGLFRVMDDPDGRELVSLHRSAKALGIDWNDGEGLRRLVPRLDPRNPKHVAFLIAARRSGGGATYAVMQPPLKPWHSAVAAMYAHATAPMRRLADRYVLDLICAQMSDSAGDHQVFATLPGVMERADKVAGRVDREAVDLVECVMLRDRIGETFTAIVVEVDKHGAIVQIADPAIRSRAKVSGAAPGDQVRVVLRNVEVGERRITLGS